MQPPIRLGLYVTLYARDMRGQLGGEVHGWPESFLTPATYLFTLITSTAAAWLRDEWGKLVGATQDKVDTQGRQIAPAGAPELAESVSGRADLCSLPCLPWVAA